MRQTCQWLLLLVGCLALSPPMAHAQWYPYPPPFPYRYHAMDDLRSAVRVEVTPKDAEVYVDGYYAGIVDDFDGVFQRLRLPPGRHEIVVRRDGFHSAAENVYLTPDSTFHLRRRLEPLDAGEPDEPRPRPMTPPAAARPGEPPPRGIVPPMSPGAGSRRPPSRRMPPPEAPPEQLPPGSSMPESPFGALVIRVQPGDAEIRIDGELWRGPSGEARLVVQLPEGAHQVEIQKEGFERFVGEVHVQGGDTTPLNVSLSRL